MRNRVDAFGAEQIIMPIMAVPACGQTNNKGAGRHRPRCANGRIFNDDAIANGHAQRLGSIEVNVRRRLAPRHMLTARINMRVKIIF